MQTMLSDKDSLNKTLTDSCNDLKEKLERRKQSADQTVKIQKEFDRLQQTHEKTMIEQSQVKEQAELKLEKELLEQEKKHHDEIQQLKVQKQEEIDNYQKKYFDLLEQIKQAQSVLSSQASETDSAEKN